MRAVVQRVSRASVSVDGDTVSEIGAGFVVLLGVSDEDEKQDAEWLADKVANLRVFEDEEGKLNRSLLDTGGRMLLVSQFTLLGDCRKGRRPSFGHAAAPERANALYLVFADRAKALGIGVEKGVFQAMMDVELVNRGPVTLLLDSKKAF